MNMFVLLWRICALFLWSCDKRIMRNREHVEIGQWLFCVVIMGELPGGNFEFVVVNKVKKLVKL